MAEQPLKAAIKQQILALPCGHQALDAEVRMTRADQRALRLELKAAGNDVPNGALWRFGDVKVKRDDTVSQPTVVCMVCERREDATVS